MKFHMKRPMERLNTSIIRQMVCQWKIYKLRHKNMKLMRLISVLVQSQGWESFILNTRPAAWVLKWNFPVTPSTNTPSSSKLQWKFVELTVEMLCVMNLIFMCSLQAHRQEWRRMGHLSKCNLFAVKWNFHFIDVVNSDGCFSLRCRFRLQQRLFTCKT